MSTVDFSTSQNVGITTQHAGIGRRLLALIIDYLVLLILFMVTFFLSTYISTVLLSLLVPVMLYSFLMEYFLNGQTLGKMAMKIRVISEDGFGLSASQCFNRWIFRIIDLQISQGAVAVTSIALTAKNKRLGDISAGTIVIKDKYDKGPIMSNTAFNANYLPVYEEAALLTNTQANIIQRVLAMPEGNTSKDLNKNMLAKQIGKTFSMPDDTLKRPDFLDVFLEDYYFFCWEIAQNQQQSEAA